MPASRRRRPVALALVCVAATLATLGTISPPAPDAAASPGPRRVSAWIAYWDQDRGYRSFVRHADLYHSVSPFWYEMRSSTSVVPFPGAEDPAIASGVRSRGVLLVPTVSNGVDGGRVSTMLASPMSRTLHVLTLVVLVLRKGYDGIDIDYEHLHASDRRRFSAFVSELGRALDVVGRKLYVTVHPKTAEPGSWHGPQAQDYAAIGAAADRVRVMAYGYHYASGPPGAVAPRWWVDEVARFASRRIPASKVELGMPLYGHDWSRGRGEPITYETAKRRMREHGATRRWSSTDSAPWFTYTAGGADHEVWYEDAASTKAKLPIVDRYGLAAATFWRLGREDPRTWTEVRRRLGA